MQKEVYININRKIEICIHSNIKNHAKFVCSEGLLKMLQIFIFLFHFLDAGMILYHPPCQMKA